MKEVNFSDTFAKGEELYRIPGNTRGAAWSTIKAHGWFSYEIKVKSEKTNTVEVVFGSYTDTLDVKVTIGDQVHEIHDAIEGKRTYTFEYEAKNEDAARIRFDKISTNLLQIL